ncbi:MAG: IclR family transcriptional regulator, partial [Thermomicrobiales bacterium]
LNTLVAAGYASRDPQTRLFVIGPRIPQLHRAFLARSRASPTTLPFLHALHQATGETVHLVRLFGEDAVTVELIAGQEPLAAGVGYVGVAMPAHVSAAGRALLAWLPAERLCAYIAGRYGHFAGPFPAADGARLEAEAAQIRNKGHAIDCGTAHPDMWCVAAPIITAAREADEALAIVTSRSRFARDGSALIAAVTAIADAAGKVAAIDLAAGATAEPDFSQDATEAVKRAIEVPL